jgi:cell wall-associated NlpC family hydrolase
MTSVSSEIKPGTIGLSQIPGITGWAIKWALIFCGDESRYAHAFIVGPNNTVIEARHGGVVVLPLTKDHPLPRGFLDVPLTDEQREIIVREALSLVGTKYSYLDYIYLAAVRLGLPSDWLKAKVISRKHLICSQLCDEVYRRAGVKLFDDGRLPLDITPGDLAALAIEYYWETLPNGDIVSRMWNFGTA